LKIQNVENVKNFATVDIETVNLNGYQVPLAISCYNGLESKVFIVEKNIFFNRP
jgi:hypothetical protein